MEGRPWHQGLAAAIPSDPAGAVAALSLALLALWIAQAAFAAWQNYLSIGVGLRGLTRVRAELFDRLQKHFPSVSINVLVRGDLIYRASWDAYSIQTLFQQGLMTFVTAALSLVVMAVVMARMNGPLTLLALALAPALVAGIRIFSSRMNERAAAAQKADSRITAAVQQNIAALTVIQSDVREAEEAAKFRAQAEEARGRRLAQHGSEVLYGLAVAVIFGLGTAGLTWLGARQVMAGRLTVGQLLVFLSLPRAALRAA